MVLSISIVLKASEAQIHENIWHRIYTSLNTNYVAHQICDQIKTEGCTKRRLSKKIITAKRTDEYTFWKDISTIM